MLYRQTTQTPNVLFDVHLKELSKSELSVLLTVIRKTIGMVDPFNKKKRVQRAWISQRLFSICTGLSTRAVSSAIDSLVRRELIVVTNKYGHPLKTKASRRGVFKLYYSSSLLLDTNQKKRKGSDLTCYNAVKKGHTIKLTAIKLLSENKSQANNRIERLSDSERIAQILQQQKGK